MASQRNFFDLTLDLHGMERDRALRLVQSHLYCGKNRGKSILIIHGCGNGVLRTAVRQFASECQLVRECWEGELYNLPGNAGVTAVFL